MDWRSPELWLGRAGMVGGLEVWGDPARSGHSVSVSLQEFLRVVLTLGIAAVLLFHVTLLRLALEAFSFKGWVHNHGLAACSNGLGIGGTALGLIRGTDPARGLSQHFQAIEVRAVREGRVGRFAFVARGTPVFVGVAFSQVREFVESQEDALTVTERDGLAFLDQVIGEAVNTALGELLTACLAGMLVAVAGVLELGASDEELEDKLVGFTTHCG